MGAAAHLNVTGAKGGDSKPKSPVEAPDSLQSTNLAKLLIAVGEGEFDGTPTDRDIYLDNTPIMDARGNINFPGVKWEWRQGSVEQDYIQGIPAVENETTVGVELRSDNPFTRALSNTQLSAVRVRMAWPRLASQDSSGNTNGYRIEYAIDIATDGGAYAEAHRGAVDGKTTNGYQRSVRVNLPAATSGWMMRVRRITPNANSGTIADTMTIAGYTEIIDEKLRYPNTALLYIEFDAQQFQNIPSVTVDCKAKRWPVPTNYDPVARTYTGVWDGTFKQAWTNNPAFVTYGLCVEDRFGLGKRIKSWMVDKWEMYRIAQYCDQLVPNGQGGQEPRFLCDLNLQGRSEAWTLLRDLSAIYRGMVYWAHGSLYMQADMPRAQDIDYVFTRSNVIAGEFVYGGAERNTHYSRALVSYDNPANNYDTDVIPVTDLALQRRYRDRPIELSAIGCTRASEAQRRGKWALLSNSQDRTVTFKTGMEGRIPLPGYVIPVADELVAGRPNGGRISSAAGRVVTLDRDTPIKAGDRLILNLPNGSAQARTVQSVNGRAVTVTTVYSVQPEPELQWAIDYEDLAIQLFRVLKTSRTQEGQYEITALEFNPSKFAAIDTGARLEERPISVIPVTVVPPPASVTLTSSSAVNQGIAVSTMTIAWPAVAGAVAYDVEWRKDNGNWIKLQRTGSTSVDVTGIYAGAYLARVRAVSAFDISSIWKSSNLTQLTGKVGLPPAVSFLNTAALVYGIGLSWGFPAGAEDTERTEIWYSKTNSRNDAIKLGDFAYPQAKHELHGLAAGVSFFFWARLIDRTGNVGPWYPAGVGVNGQSSADQSEYEEYFKDKITEGALYPALQERIDLIDGPPSLPGSVSQRVEEVKDQVEEINDQLGEQISQVQGNLQQQIDQVSAIANSAEYQKEKAYAAGASTRLNDRLYQAKIAVPADLTGAKAPPNTTYWLDVGQVVSQSNGLAGRVTTVETKVTEQDGKLTAQSERIDGVQSSLTVTNGNVTAAQNAAQAAADLAGGKGKVLTQSATPAAADRLPQNLWIDTTGGANTPKRWNGSAWVAVTDKVATDAAAAAANALSVANTKADASTVSSIGARVTAAEGTISSQGQALTGLNNSLTTTNQNVTTAQQVADAANALAGGKGKVIIQSGAPAAGDRLVQNLWIDTTGNANTPKRWTGSAWAAVTDKAATDAAAAAASALAQVATKAEASTVQALSNEVTQQGQTITAQGQAITNVQTSVGNIGGAGANLLPAEYGAFSESAPVTSTNAVYTVGVEADPSTYNGFALKVTANNASPGNAMYFVPAAASAIKYTHANMGFKRGKYIVSYNARASVDGHVIAPFLKSISADNTNVNSTIANQQQALTTAWARYSAVVDMTAAGHVGDLQMLCLQMNVSGVSGRTIWIDRVMVELAVGESAAPSPFNLGNSFRQVGALATATQSLDGRTTQTEQGLTSQGAAITGLNNSLTTTNQNVTTAQQAADAANSLAGGKGKVIIQSAAPAATDRLPQNLWIDTASNANTPKRWTGSAWAAVTDKAATDAAAAAASALAQVATKAEASTVQALSNEVTQQGQTIAAHGQAITHINVSVANSDSENWIRNPLFNVGGDVSSNAFTTYVAGTDPSVPQPCPSTRVGVMTKAASGLLTIALPIKNGSYRVPVLVGETLALSIRMAVIGGATNSSRMVVTFYDQGGANLGNHRVVTYNQAVTGWQQPAGSIVVPSGAVSAGVSIFNETAGPVGSVIFFAEPVLNRMDGASGVVAAATQSLDARVATAEDGITSQGSALTQLTNTVAGKADNSALQSLGSTVAQQGSTLSAQGTAVTQLQSTVGGIGGSGSNLLPAEYCAFGETVPVFYKAGGITVSTEAEAGAYSGSMLKVVSPASGQNHIYMASALADYNLRVEPGAKYIVSFTVKSDVAKVLRVRVRAPNSAGVSIETTLSDVSVAAGIGRYSFVATMPAAVVDRGLLLFFIPQPVAAGTTWLDALMVERQVGTASTPSDFSPGPSSRAIAGQATAISQLNTTVNQQGTAITAQASRLDGLYVQVNPEMEGDSSGLAGATGSFVGVWTEQSARVEDGIATGRRVDTVQSQVGAVEGSVQLVSASVQQVSETLAGVDGKVSAMTTIKAETTTGGRKVMAGLALGSDGQTSEILAFAQRFAIVDESSGNMSLPFVVQGGQVFINQAVINKAFIQEIVAGMTIRSAAVNSQGLPLLELNFVTGAVSIRSSGAGGSTLFNNDGFYVYDQNQVRRTALGKVSG